MVQPSGNLFIVAAPSGAGKSSLIAALLALSSQTQEEQTQAAAQAESLVSKRVLNRAELSVSHTTRKPREGEIDGVHYHFVDIPQFEALIKDNAFYEYAKVFDNYYGTSKAAISDKLNDGIDVFLDIDWQGARQIKAITPEVVSIFILPPSIDALRARLVGRGKDSEDVIAKRMREAVSEMSHYDEFDYIIVNDDFEQALSDFVEVINAQTLTQQKQSMRHADLIAALVP